MRRTTPAVVTAVAIAVLGSAPVAARPADAPLAQESAGRVAAPSLEQAPPQAAVIDAPRANPYARTNVLLGVGLGFAGVHAVDNVLSYRTFTATTPVPTLVQFIYAAGAAAWALDAGPLFWIVYSTALLTAHSLGHLFVPTAENYLPTFYQHWATGDNRLQVTSNAMGRVSQGLLIGLDLSFLGVLISSIEDGTRKGFTVLRRE